MEQLPGAKKPAKLAIVVPCFNEGGRIAAFLRQLDAELPPLVARFPMPVAQAHCVIVDDGSTPDPRLLASLAGEKRGFSLTVLRHPVNLGQGAAIQTGVQFARDKLQADLFVTMDSDGQHRPSDLPALVEALVRERADIVFGNRFTGEGPKNMPRSRKLLLSGATFFERMLTGLPLGDAHNGYRAFNRAFAEKLDFKQNRMAHATEFKQLVREHGFRYAEAPVTITYTEETRAKGQKNLGFLSILKELVSVYLFQQ